MGPTRLSDYIQRYGFGHKTDIALPGEVSGIAHPLAKWNSLSITRIPMGHEVAVTSLQMLMAMNTIANNGMRMKLSSLMIVKRHREMRTGRRFVQYEGGAGWPSRFTTCLRVDDNGAAQSGGP